MQPDKSFVQQKFKRITRWYDFLNSLLSLGLDHYWRWQTVKCLKGIKGVVLDLCAGTLPLSKALLRWIDFKGKIIALDFCPSMLFYGYRKEKRIFPIAGDALSLPLKNESIDAVMVAFGVRNFTDQLAGLKEMKRVLKDKGKLVILEFSHPLHPYFKAFYFAYLKHLLPKIGGIISGEGEAYQYLSNSIALFYQPNEWMNLMKKAGFHNIKHRYLTNGIVSLYTAIKSLS